MYNISHIEFYKLYDASVDKIIDYFYSKDELIKFIARWYRTNKWAYDFLWADDFFKCHKSVSNSFIEQCTCDINELFKNSQDQYYRCYILYDNFDRIINVHDFESDALKLYQNWEAEGRVNTYSWSSFTWRLRRRRSKSRKYEFLRKMDSNYRYRKDPVPHTRKWRGGQDSHRRIPQKLCVCMQILIINILIVIQQKKFHSGGMIVVEKLKGLGRSNQKQDINGKEGRSKLRNSLLFFLKKYDIIIM